MKIALLISKKKGLNSWLVTTVLQKELILANKLL